MLCVEELNAENKGAICDIAELESMVFSDAWSLKAIESTIKQQQSICAIAQEDGRTLGYYLCYSVLDECEIARIAVDQKVRRKGIGQSLFSHLLQICREKNIIRILLDVRESNLPAISFYEKNGFVRDGIRKDYYRGTHPENAILMSLDLEKV